MIGKPLLQVISTSPNDSKIIEDFGANRIELVAALQIGGITPSKALLRKSLEVAAIKTMVMVRHHNQGFILSNQQKELLAEEAASLIDLGCNGIVLGAITQEKKVDQHFLKMLQQKVSLNKIDITFHKAADQVSDLSEAYQTIKKYQIGRVLTQGGLTKVQDNFQSLKKVMSINNVITLIGGGIGFANVEGIIKELKPLEMHIGTCVRKDKYGPVDGKLVQKFIEKMSTI